MQTSELFLKEHTQVQGIVRKGCHCCFRSNCCRHKYISINEWEEFLNIPTASRGVPDLLSNENIVENIQNAQISVDRHIDQIATNSNHNNNRDNSDDEWYDVEELLSGFTDST